MSSVAVRGDASEQGGVTGEMATRTERLVTKGDEWF